MKRPTPCSQPEIHLVGEIAVSFGNLEFLLEGGIWKLLCGEDEQTQKLGEAITAEMSFSRKLYAFSSMYRLRVPSASEDHTFRSMINELDKVQAERNAILHSAWSYSPKLKVLRRMKSEAKTKRGLRHRMSYMTPEKLEAILSRISQAGDRFGKFVIEHVQDQTWE